MNRILGISCLFDLGAAALGAAAMAWSQAGLLIPAAGLLLAGMGYGFARFRCPCCGRFLGPVQYRPGRFCYYCGAFLDGAAERSSPAPSQPREKEYQAL